MIVLVKGDRIYSYTRYVAQCLLRNWMGFSNYGEEGGIVAVEGVGCLGWKF